MASWMRHLPNLISGLRLALVPVFVLLFFSGNPLWIAALVYLIAGLSDLLDGYLARRYRWFSPLGRVLDPLADKLLQLSGLTCLVMARLLPLWMLPVLLGKELVMLAGGALLAKRIGEVPPSNRFGKFVSFLLYTATLAVLVLQPGETLRTALVAAVIGLSVLAMGNYGLGTLRNLKNRSAEHDS